MKYQRLEDLRTDRDLTISIAIRLAELYQVSLDYLVGISDEKRPYGS